MTKQSKLLVKQDTKKADYISLPLLLFNF